MSWSRVRSLERIRSFGSTAPATSIIRAEMMGARSRGIVLAMLGSVAASPVEAAFTRWQVTLGTGQEKRILMKIDAAQQKA